MLKKFIVVILLSFIGGCGAVVHPPIAIEAAKAIKSGTPLLEITQQFGEAHPPTAKQASALAETIARMPDAVRNNAERDKSLAWGNDDAFLVVKVNDQEVAWVTAWRSGGTRPGGKPR